MRGPYFFDTVQKGMKMTRKKQRKYGLLPRQMWVNTLVLIKDGTIDPKWSAKQAASVYILSMASDKRFGVTEAWMERSSIDIDKLIQFATVIMELILKLAPLFL